MDIRCSTKIMASYIELRKPKGNNIETKNGDRHNTQRYFWTKHNEKKTGRGRLSTKC